LSQQINSTLKN